MEDERTLEEIAEECKNYDYSMIARFGGISAEDLCEWKYGNDYERFGNKSQIRADM